MPTRVSTSRCESYVPELPAAKRYAQIGETLDQWIEKR
jgi:hypothetical protein